MVSKSKTTSRLRAFILIGISGLFFSLYSFSTVAEVIFEGYAKISAGSEQIGYYIQRYEFDPKKKQFTGINYIKTNPSGGDITESLKAIANEKFQPISYQYTSRVGSTIKIIDAKFKGKTMTFMVSDGKAKNTFTKQLPDGVFLSTFLQYLMLQNGYEVGKKFVYTAISEEDGGVHTGEALIKEEMDFKETKGFRVLNEFKGSQFISFVTPKGEVLGTVSPVQDISTELMATPSEALTGHLLQTKTLQLLFGKVPEGKLNPLAKRLAKANAPTETPPPEASLKPPAQTPAKKTEKTKNQ